MKIIVRKPVSVIWLNHYLLCYWVQKKNPIQIGEAFSVQVFKKIRQFVFCNMERVYSTAMKGNKSKNYKTKGFLQ